MCLQALLLGPAAFLQVAGKPVDRFTVIGGIGTRNPSWKGLMLPYNNLSGATTLTGWKHYLIWTYTGTICRTPPQNKGVGAASMRMSAAGTLPLNIYLSAAISKFSNGHNNLYSVTTTV